MKNLIGYSCYFGGMKKFGWALLLLVAACKTGTFQIKDGNTARALLRYDQAIEMLSREFQAEKDLTKQQQKAFQIAEMCARLNRYAEAEKWYKQSVDLNGGEASLWGYAMMLKQQEKYEDAMRAFDQAMRLSGKTLEARQQMNQCRDALEWKKAFTRLQITNLSINSAYSDYGLEPFKNNQYVFTSARPESTGGQREQLAGEYTNDLFITDVKTGQFSAAVPFPAPVNTPEFEGSPTFSSDFKEMFFVRCRRDDKSNQYCHVYYTAFNNEHWNEPAKLDLFADTVNVYDPYLSADGKTLLVAADVPDNFGETDIYLFTKTDSGWSAPKNLGSAINTPGSERFPWLDEKGNLYFSSNGLPGMGGLDIFKATRSKTGFKDPQNLRWPINSGADDFAYRIEKYRPAHQQDTILSAGYFTSNRSGGKGSDDVYRFEEKWVNIFVLRGKVVEKKYENPENSESRVLGLQPLPKARVDLKTADDQLLATVQTDTAGKFIFRLEAETDYKLSVSKSNYFNKNEYLSTKGKRHPDSTYIYLYAEVELEKIFPQKEIVIPNIYYDYDKATLRPESQVVLDSIFIFFKENPDLIIEIGSHTDSRGSDSYNMKLSQARAQSVVDYLVAKGIPADRLLAKGYGETKPVNGCVNGVNCTEEEFQKNRRTTFRVISSKLKLESVEPGNIRVDPKKE
ncbi:MAG: OmpA family protein [Chitinophagales bacterium]|nr:OmpA family protein [Chitinophagales bacterium]MDW8420030.1 OmpA family protein [Chitinophagales bacterium]